jgi:hypothetical protein
MNLVRAYLLGVYDGAMSPDDLAFGRTWPGRERCNHVGACKVVR